MSECNHDCSSCSSKCENDTTKFLVENKTGSKIKKIIGVLSGKGGVGKSLVTSLLATASSKANFKTAVLDADITGPSIPKSFGLTEKAMGDADGNIFPVVTKGGIKVMSINLLLENDNQPVVWRGPVLSGVVKQFYGDVVWGDVDYMFIDMPPGTSDVALTTFQSIKIDGIIIVTTPQDLVNMIVEKAVNMANMMNIPILGVVENMSYYSCPHCNEKIYLYGESKLEKICEDYDLKPLAKLPIDNKLTKLVDSGNIEDETSNYLGSVFEIIK